MDAVTKEIRRVQRVIRLKILTRRALARMAGISDTALIPALRADWNPKAETLSALSRALDDVDRASHADAKKKSPVAAE